MGQLEKLEAAVIRLLRTQSKVFYASILIQMIRQETEHCPTMGVTISNGRVYLYYNVKFVDTLSMDELVAILEHEILHLVMEHIFRCKNRQPEIWNIAADMAINQMLEGLPLKKKDPKTGMMEGPVCHKDYNLPENLPAEAYYNALMKNATKISMSCSGNEKGEGKDDQSNNQGQGVIDDHSGWKKAGENSTNSKGDFNKEVVKQMIREAYEECQKRRGFLPGGLEEVIKEWLKTPEIPWSVLLRQFIGGTVKCGSEDSWHRPSRRLGEGYKGRIPVMTVKIGVAIDTSGSVSDLDFQEFIAEMKAIQMSYKNDITIMECDAAVQKVYTLQPYSKVDTKFKGRGGTAYEPIFQKITEEPRYRPDLLVYFTDFYCTFPEKRPTFPVLWVVCSNGNPNNTPPFGAVIRMKKGKK